MGRFKTLDAFPLIVGGRWFSPYLIDEPGNGHRVFGEVFQVDQEGLDLLDRIEGLHHSEGFRRIALTVENGKGGVLDAWTYVKARDAIDGIHSRPMEEYNVDVRYVGPSSRTTPF